MTDVTVTVKMANAMLTGNEIIVTGGINNLGHCNGTFVTEKIADGQWRVTKMPADLPTRVARALIFLRRHGPLLIVGDSVFSDSPRERIKGVTSKMLIEAAAFRPRVVRMDFGRVTMTDRGRGFFLPQDRLVFSVPTVMVAAVTEAVENVLAGHHIRPGPSDQ